ncbi:hypothetical protein BJ508DRAFT_302659 [Ascobolus immersus RN42]|uniref:Uncharacterized protein n=1 Tax=Ascobolus immersus RN42 TaxID=1160509 RepID=A0A3N4IK72_ASCIM|nr:hypothetical protein BJ508DRAFT_302659 [Ascobolus immersus RN42]
MIDFLSLPNELRLEIASHIQSWQDHSSFRQMDRTNHTLLSNTKIVRKQFSEVKFYPSEREEIYNEIRHAMCCSTQKSVYRFLLFEANLQNVRFNIPSTFVIVKEKDSWMEYIHRRNLVATLETLMALLIDGRSCHEHGLDGTIRNLSEASGYRWGSETGMRLSAEFLHSFGNFALANYFISTGVIQSSWLDFAEQETWETFQRDKKEWEDWSRRLKDELRDIDRMYRYAFIID